MKADRVKMIQHIKREELYQISCQKIEAERTIEWYILKYWRNKKGQPGILYLVKISFKIKAK